MKQLTGHQGDVGFKTSSIPKEAIKITNKPIALGEHSGHMHVLTGDVELFEHNGTIYASVGSDGARLQHCHESNFSEACWTTTKEIAIADHKSHLLPQGNYEFWIQNAYNPYSKLMEKVID